MPSLEYAFRPSTSPDSHGRIIIPSTPTATKQRATLTWGAKATMPPKVAQGPQLACCKEVNTEVPGTRKGETVRIFQNNDSTSSNWVDVNRATQVNLQKKGNNSCFGSAPDDFNFTTVGDAMDALAAQFDLAFGVTTVTDSCNVTWDIANNTQAA